MATQALSPKAHPEDVGVQILNFDVNFATPDIGSTNGVQIGALPVGAIILRSTVNVLTAFNAATTNDLSIGVAGATSDLMTTAVSIASAVGVKTQVGRPTGAQILTADTGIFVRYAQTGAAATAGRAIGFIEFYPVADYAP